MQQQRRTSADPLAVATNMVLLTAALSIGCGALGDKDSATRKKTVATASGEAVARAIIGGEGAASEIAGFNFVVTQGQFMTERYAPLEVEDMPDHVGSAFGVDGLFADAYFVLEEGTYNVTATPLNEQGTRVLGCTVAEGQVTVQNASTSEVILESSCDAAPTGGADVVAVVVNTGPQIVDLEFDPSKFVVTCELLEVTVVAEDADGDQLDIRFEKVTGPASIAPLEQLGQTLSFETDVEGLYEYRVTVCDVSDACTDLIFPIHVSPDVEDCVVQNGPVD